MCNDPLPLLPAIIFDADRLHAFRPGHAANNPHKLIAPET
jgi:hypothetical protein